MNPGSLYILSNAYFLSDIFKIGKTKHLVEVRAGQLSRQTAAPGEFKVMFQVQVGNRDSAERLLKRQLAPFRISKRKEFYQLPLKTLCGIVNEVASQYPIQPATCTSVGEGFPSFADKPDSSQYNVNSQEGGTTIKVALPGDDRLLYSFALELLDILKDKGLFRRDSIVMYCCTEEHQLRPMTASTFRVWVAQRVACYKRRRNSSGSVTIRWKRMSRDDAEAVLACFDFWQGLPEIEVINPVPMPAIDGNGRLTLSKPGCDAQTKTLTLAFN